ncbi:type II secretion system F family protein [Nocardiopsis composta]|uniref:Uncharacterized protein n=1 Tax=Nocardiopsis composta TaxID=157465 RepID=A0A7W8QRC9_9ACTN|nr:type II secretion system F family protein [Nocardiopsis composta]MBB5435208.1 hypothetical protein [Nocardiopsis composta]
MSALIAAAAGGSVAGGVWMLARALRRPALADLLTPHAEHTFQENRGGGIAARLGTPLVPLLARAGLPAPAIRRDLGVGDTAVEDYLAEKATATVAGAAVAALLAAAWASGLSPLPPLAVFALAAGCAAACWHAPDAGVRAQARRRRAEMAQAASMLADLSVIALAGGAGVNGALTQAARHGEGWAPGRIRAALHASAVRRRPPWEGLTELAEATGTTGLEELAASLRLAGTDGARVRASIAAKAASLRTAELAAAEARAAAATEQMTLPVTVLVLGFMGLIGYPALVHVVTGF